MCLSLTLNWKKGGAHPFTSLRKLNFYNREIPQSYFTAHQWYQEEEVQNKDALTCYIYSNESLTLHLMPFNGFANKADPDQAALTISWSTLFVYGNMIIYDPALMDLTSNFIVLCS